jgi:hypothetical protein
LNCPYLKYLTKTCNACSGYYCTSKGKEKKVPKPEDLCMNEDDWVECVRYVETLGDIIEAAELGNDFTVKLPEAEIPVFPKDDVELLIEIAGAEKTRICPYQGPTPVGRASCTGVHCYAEDKCVRVLKNCRNWTICTPYLMSKYMGKPYYKAT